MKLYELATQYKELQNLEDMKPEDIADTLEGIEGEISEKAQSIVAVREGIKADIDAINAQIARLEERKKIVENRQAEMENYLKTNMQRTGISNIKCPYFSITLAKGREKVLIENEDILPDEYVIATTHEKPDRVKILKDLKAGKVVTGARLVRSDDSLRIK